jgi:hypothetical protein
MNELSLGPKIVSQTENHLKISTVRYYKSDLVTYHYYAGLIRLAYHSFAEVSGSLKIHR